MTMIERVARAICLEEHKLVYPDSAWREGELERKVEQYWRRQIPAARAAITAQRTATEAMIRAGGVAWHKADPYDAAALVWDRMIEAALAETDQRATRVTIDPKTIVDRNVLPPPPDDPVVDALPASRSWPVPDDFWP